MVEQAVGPCERTPAVDRCGLDRPKGRGGDADVRDLASDPPAKWNLDMQREYFDWAKQVIDQLRGAHSQLEKLFDLAYSKRV